MSERALAAYKGINGLILEFFLITFVAGASGQSQAIPLKALLFQSFDSMRSYLFLIPVICLATLLYSSRTNAQTLQVSSNITPQELVQQVLIGGGVATSNITYTGAAISRGEFWGGPGNIGVESGVLLTSGNVTIAPGPNNAGGAGANANTVGDPDLTAIANVNTNDACILEFDFIPQSSVVSFRYVFASEEYHEYVNQFNDAFGFFISGPGISGPYSNNSKNIALIPLSSTPVSINTVNNGPSNTGPCTNCQYFVHNNQGFTQYDAFTTVLTAWANVIPCETYHIKLAIGDGLDHAFDSGVFLEAGSFNSVGIGTEIEYTHGQYADFATEGCNDASIPFVLSEPPDEPFYLPVTISGSAINGVDYEEINDSVFFPAGWTEVDVDIIPIVDYIPEWTENVLISYNSSLCGIDIDTAVVRIYDYYEMFVETTPDTTINCATTAVVGVSDLGGFEPYTIIWSTGDTTDYITVNPLITTTYYVTVYALCDSLGMDSVTVFVNGPEADAGNDQSIPHGTTTTLQGSAGQGSGDYTFSWEPASQVTDPTSPTPQTVQLEQTTLFTLVVTDLAGGCQDMDQVTVYVTGGPLAANPIASPPEICIGGSSQLFPYVSGGSENYTFTWTSVPPGFNSDLPNPIVQPLVNTTYNLVVDDGYNFITGSTEVTVLPLPVADAGADDTIPHGTYTMLHGSASIGSGNYTWSWEPAGKLVNPYAQNPITHKLYETTLFRLEVTDNITGCTSAVEDLVTIVVSGGALGVDAEATNELICLGETTQLHALGYGGNFPVYTYEWSSVPPGFTSTDPEPFITPDESTEYLVEIYDEFNYSQGSVTVEVSPPPQFDLGPDISACPYDTVDLQVIAPGMSYYWSNGSTESEIHIGTTGIGFDIKKIWVEVENQHGCVSTDTIQVIFDFSQCFGVEEIGGNSRIQLYPNPTAGLMHLEASGIQDRLDVRVTNVQGQVVLSTFFEVSPDGLVRGNFNVAGNPQGIYFVQLIDADRVYVRKITLR